MNLEDYRTYCNNIMNREELGAPSSPDEFNTLIKLAVNEFYRDQYNVFMQAWRQAPDGVSLSYYQIALKNLLKKANLTNSGDGTVALPDDYRYPVSASLQIDGVFTNAEILSPDQMDNALYNDFLDISEYPVLLITDDIEGIPNSYTDMLFRYFKTVAEPNYDYCVSNSTGRVIYMPVGTQLAVDDTGTTNLIDTTSGTTLVILATDVSHVDNPTLPYTSQSVEVFFSDDYFSEIAGKVIEAMAAKTRESSVMNYGKSEQQ